MATQKGTSAQRAETHAVLASPTRVRLLDALRDSPTPMSLAELAALCGLHVTTVRFHLDALAGAGLVSTAPERRPTRGRPRRLYQALTSLERDHHGDSGYELLARVLATHWASGEGDAVDRVEAAGRAWALEDLAACRGAPRSLEDAVGIVTTLFAEMGFDPELEASEEEVRIHLHACPFESVARQNPHVVCALHLGLMRGVLARLGAPDTDNRLVPWETPRTCVAHLMR